ncbi:MAG: LysM peptidoglycan-binding domain-containing protein [Polyangiales bacterium]
MRRIALLLVLALLGDGCDKSDPPVEPAIEAQQPLSDPDVVRTTPTQLGDEQHSTAESPLPTGQASAAHQIQPGQTVWSIARLYDLSMDDLLSFNNLTDDDARQLRAGATIQIPGVRDDQLIVEKPATVASTGIQHTMGPGENIWDLSREYKVGVSEIMAANALSIDDVKTLRSGRQLLIPGVTKSVLGKPRRVLSKKQTEASTGGKKLGLGTRRTASLLMTGRVSECVDSSGGRIDAAWHLMARQQGSIRSRIRIGRRRLPSRGRHHG